MIGFYVIIAMWTWFYVGQPGQEVMLACKTTVAEALANLANEGSVEGAASGLATGLF